jgi:hypothetical protein
MPEGHSSGRHVATSFGPVSTDYFKRTPNMRKKAAGNAEQAIDAVATVEPIKTRAPAKSLRVKTTKVTKAAGPGPTAKPAKRSESPRISLATLAMGTAAVPVVEESPVAKQVRPAKVSKVASAAKSVEPAAKVAKVAKVSKTAKPVKSAKSAKSAKAAQAGMGADIATGTKRPIKGIRLASSLAGLANANPTPFVEEAQEVHVPEVVPSVPPITMPNPAMEIRLAAPAEVMPPPILVAAPPRPQQPRRWLIPGLALLAIALAGLVVTQLDAPGDDAQAPFAAQTPAQTPAMAAANGGPVPYGPGPYRPAAYRPHPGPDHSGQYIDNEGRAYGRYSRHSTHW